MEIHIENDVSNKLLNRREIRFSCTYAGKTPGKEELKVELCKKLSLSPETTAIVRLEQLYGVMKSTGLAHSYSDAESMKIEPPYLSERKNKAAKPKAEAKSGATA